MSNRWKVFDVALIGTSLTSYIGGWEQNFRSRLQAMSGRPIRTYNFGVPGATTIGGLASIPAAARLRPAAAIMEYGMNDAQTATAITLSAFKTNLANIVTAFRADNFSASTIFLMTMNPAIGAAAGLAPNLANYYQGVRDVASSAGVGLIDAYPAWMATSPTSADIPDGIHPTVARADAVLVSLILDAVAPVCD